MNEHPLCASAHQEAVVPLSTTGDATEADNDPSFAFPKRQPQWPGGAKGQRAAQILSRQMLQALGVGMVRAIPALHWIRIMAYLRG
jgi:hypothetical protein